MNGVREPYELGISLNHDMNWVVNCKQTMSFNDGEEIKFIERQAYDSLLEEHAQHGGSRGADEK